MRRFPNAFYLYGMKWGSYPQATNLVLSGHERNCQDAWTSCAVSPPSLKRADSLTATQNKRVCTAYPMNFQQTWSRALALGRGWWETHTVETKEAGMTRTPQQRTPPTPCSTEARHHGFAGRSDSTPRGHTSPGGMRSNNFRVNGTGETTARHFQRWAGPRACEANRPEAYLNQILHNSVSYRRHPELYFKPSTLPGWTNHAVRLLPPGTSKVHQDKLHVAGRRQAGGRQAAGRQARQARPAPDRSCLLWKNLRQVMFFHADALSFNGLTVVFPRISQYLNTPFEVATRWWEFSDPLHWPWIVGKIKRNLKQLNETIMKSSWHGFQLLTQNLLDDSKYYFLETSSRVGAHGRNGNKVSIFGQNGP